MTQIGNRNRRPVDPDKTANVVMHPLFLLVRVFDNASLRGAADVSVRTSTPLVQQDPKSDHPGLACGGFLCSEP